MLSKAKLTPVTIVSILAAMAMALCSATAQIVVAAEEPQSVIIFVADGLRAGSVNPTDAPTMFTFKSEGVWFSNSYSLYPTVTMANASAIAPGHGLGDTSILGNSLFIGPGSNGPVGFIEQDKVLASLRSEFSTNFPPEETLLAAARAKGLQTAVIGKSGPAFLQDVTQTNTDAAIIIDDDTGSPAGVPLTGVIKAELIAKGISTVATNRSNGQSRRKISGPPGIDADQNCPKWAQMLFACFYGAWFRGCLAGRCRSDLSRGNSRRHWFGSGAARRRISGSHEGWPRR
jgi:hypothetical protein